MTEVAVFGMATLTSASLVCTSQSHQRSFVAVFQSSRLTRTSLISNKATCRRSPLAKCYRVSCSASDFEEGELVSGVKAGDKLKVKESRVVYHSPKHKVATLQLFGRCCWLASIMAVANNICAWIFFTSIVVTMSISNFHITLIRCTAC